MNAIEKDQAKVLKTIEGTDQSENIWTVTLRRDNTKYSIESRINGQMIGKPWTFYSRPVADMFWSSIAEKVKGETKEKNGQSLSSEGESF